VLLVCVHQHPLSPTDWLLQRGAFAAVHPFAQSSSADGANPAHFQGDRNIERIFRVLTKPATNPAPTFSCTSSQASCPISYTAESFSSSQPSPPVVLMPLPPCASPAVHYHCCLCMHAPTSFPAASLLVPPILPLVPPEHCLVPSSLAPFPFFLLHVWVPPCMHWPPPNRTM
jgi:hypothetical protein